MLIMKSSIKSYGAVLASLLLTVFGFATERDVVAHINPGQTADLEEFRQVAVPAGAAYTYHIYAYPAPSGYGSAYVAIGGGGVVVNDYVYSPGAKDGSGSFSSSGLVDATCTVYGNGYATCESAVSVYW